MDRPVGEMHLLRVELKHAERVAMKQTLKLSLSKTQCWVHVNAEVNSDNPRGLQPKGLRLNCTKQIGFEHAQDKPQTWLVHNALLQQMGMSTCSKTFIQT